MNRRGFLAALVIAPVVPVAIKFSPPSHNLAFEMERLWRECISSQKAPQFIVCGMSFERTYAESLA